jgi:hypothetical protein
MAIRILPGEPEFCYGLVGVVDVVKRGSRRSPRIGIRTVWVQYSLAGEMSGVTRTILR